MKACELTMSNFHTKNQFSDWSFEYGEVLKLGSLYIAKVLEVGFLVSISPFFKVQLFLKVFAALRCKCINCHQFSEVKIVLKREKGKLVTGGQFESCLDVVQVSDIG